MERGKNCGDRRGHPGGHCPTCKVVPKNPTQGEEELVPDGGGRAHAEDETAGEEAKVDSIESESSRPTEDPSNWWIVLAVSALFISGATIALVFRVDALSVFVDVLFVLADSIGIVPAIIVMKFLPPVAMFLDASRIRESDAVDWAPMRWMWFIGLLVTPIFVGLLYLYERHRHVGRP